MQLRPDSYSNPSHRDTRKARDFSEEAERQCCDFPPTLASEVEKLNAKLTEYKKVARRVNLRIYGFPERVEDKDAISFLRATLPEILRADFKVVLDAVPLDSKITKKHPPCQPAISLHPLVIDSV